MLGSYLVKISISHLLVIVSFGASYYLFEYPSNIKKLDHDKIEISTLKYHISTRRIHTLLSPKKNCLKKRQSIDFYLKFGNEQVFDLFEKENKIRTIDYNRSGYPTFIRQCNGGISSVEVY